MTRFRSPRLRWGHCFSCHKKYKFTTNEMSRRSKPFCSTCGWPVTPGKLVSRKDEYASVPFKEPKIPVFKTCPFCKGSHTRRYDQCYHCYVFLKKHRKSLWSAIVKEWQKPTPKLDVLYKIASRDMRDALYLVHILM